MSISAMQRFKKGRAAPGKRVWFDVQAEPAEVFIFGEIGRGFEGGGTTPEILIGEVKALNLGHDDVLNVRINSPGGDFFDGNTIYNFLRSLKQSVTVTIDGVAASAASVIAMAGDTIRMPENSFLFIHNPWAISAGDASTMRKMADDLDTMRDGAVKTYQSRVGDNVSRDELVTMLDNETWIPADKAIAMGFADELVEPVKAAALARFDLGRWPNLPSTLSVKAVEGEAATDELRAFKQARKQRERAEIDQHRQVLHSLK